MHVKDSLNTVKEVYVFGAGKRGGGYATLFLALKMFKSWDL